MHAAGCQLDTAIELFFENREIVSICMLTYSAWSIVKDIYKHGKKPNIPSQKLCREYFFDGLKEQGSEPYKKIDELWNFLKHSNKDPNATYEFSADMSEHSLFCVVSDFSNVFPKTSKTMDVYYHWWLSKYRNSFEDNKEDINKVKEWLLKAEEKFPDLQNKSLKTQKQLGLRAIKELHHRL